MEIIDKNSKDLINSGLDHNVGHFREGSVGRGQACVIGVFFKSCF